MSRALVTSAVQRLTVEKGTGSVTSARKLWLFYHSHMQEAYSLYGVEVEGRPSGNCPNASDGPCAAPTVFTVSSS